MLPEGAVHDIASAAEAFERMGQQDAETPPQETADAPQAELEVEQPQGEQTEEPAETQDEPTEGEETEEADAEEGAEIDLGQLAASLGLDADDISYGEEGLKVKVKIDGELSEVPLSQLRKSYQLEGHLTKKSMELAETRKAIEAERQQLQAQYGQELNQLAALQQHLESEFLADYQAVNWDQLRQLDPAEYAAKRQEFADRQHRINAVKAGLSTKAQEYQQEQAKQQEAQLQNYLSEQRQQLLDKIPEWSDKAKAQSEMAAMRKYLVSNGFEEAEATAIYDHRHVLLIRDAMRYREMTSKADAAKKKVATLPKVMKPGTSKTKAEAHAEQRKQQLGRLKKSGKVEDAADFFLRTFS